MGMTMMADSAFGPTPTAVQWLHDHGYTVYAAYLPSPGAYHVWTNEEWAAIETFERWGIAFPGADPAVIAYNAKLRGCRGVVVDLEAQFVDNANVVNQAQNLCSAMRNRAIPVVGYSNDRGADKLAPFADGTWRDRNYPGAPRIPTPVPPKTAYQINSLGVGGTSLDTSVCDSWYGAVSIPAPPPPPVTEYDMANISKTSGTVIIGADGRGWWNIPTTLNISSIVSVVVYTQNPQTIGHYAAVPAFAGVAWDPGALVFGTGTDGQAPAGAYGFDLWYV